MHPNPIVKLPQERTHQCPCGAVPEYPHGMCRKCYAGMVWHRRKNGPARRLPAQARTPVSRAEPDPDARRVHVAREQQGGRLL